MSRGPGRWHRYLLDSVSDGKPHYLADLLAPGATRAEYNAINRAALRLRDQGAIEVWSFASGNPRTAVAPAGMPFPDRGPAGRGALLDWPRWGGRPAISVGQVPGGHPSNTYVSGEVLQIGPDDGSGPA